MSGRKRRRTRSKNQNNVIIVNSFNPQGENVNFRDIDIGSTFESGSQPGSSKSSDETERKKRRCSRKFEIEKKIKSNLTRQFEKIKLPKLSWLQTSNISIEKYTELELRWNGESKCNENIKLQNVFDVSKKGDKLRRIFIESEPGFGKTTLAHKIVSDWVKKEKYVSRFKFTILVMLKWVGSKSMKEYVVDKIGVDESDAGADYVWKLINTEETLLILDGLDEISEKDRQNIQEVLFDPKNKYMMTTLATSRVGLHGCSDSTAGALFGGVETGDDFWDKKITILGIIGDSRRRAFFQNFLEDDESELLARLCDITLSRDEQFKSPLLLILLVYILRGNEVTKIVTNTDLYKNLVDCVIKRNVSKNNPNVTLKNFSIFDDSYKLVMQCGRDRESFYKFGEMSVDHILNDNLQFDNNDTTSAVYELGFLSKHENPDSFEPNYFYEGFHLTLVEFAVSFYVLEECRKSDKQFSQTVIEKINQICVKKGNFSMVLPFLCGLLEKDVAYLFDRLSPYSVFYCRTKKSIGNILRECVMDDDIGKCFARLFSPCKLNVDNLVGKSMLSNQHLVKNLKCLTIDSPYLWDIQFPIVVDSLNVVLKNEQITRAENCARIANYIQCKTTILSINDVLSYNVIEQHLKLLAEISSGCKHLLIENTANVYTVVKKCLGMDNNILDRLKLDFFFVRLSVKRDMNKVKQMLGKIKVKNLHLVFINDSVARAAIDLVSVAATINYTTSMVITFESFNEHFLLDFDQFTNNKEKQWELLRIDNTIVQCKYPLQYKPNIKSFSINPTRILSKLDNEINALLSLTPTLLHCNYRLLELLSRDDRASSWGGWESVVELMLTISDSHSPSELGLSNFSRFVNVTTLHLEIISRIEENELTNIVTCLKLTNINRLEIRWNNECYIDDLVFKIQDAFSHVECVIVIEIVCDPLFKKLKDIQFNFKQLKAILNCNSKIAFRFLFYLYKNLKDFTRQNCKELQLFDTEYEWQNCDFKTPILNCVNNTLNSSYSYNVLILKSRKSVGHENVLTWLAQRWLRCWHYIGQMLGRMVGLPN